jgi:sortase A
VKRLTAAPGQPSRPAGRRDRRSIALVLAGAVLVTGGAAVVAPAVWNLSAGSAVAAASQQHAAAALSSTWARSSNDSTGALPSREDAVPVSPTPSAGGTVAVITVPRFGADWRRVVRQGVDVQSILNSFTAGVGHYPGAVMPGGIGNVALAAHDTGYGDAFLRVGDLRIGDRIVLQTKLGWYTYEFRNFQWVQPTEVAVILPVPERAKVAATDRLITLTTCDPPFNAQEREIAYGVFVGFRPVSEGAPAA